jgi:hypothetical protein
MIGGARLLLQIVIVSFHQRTNIALYNTQVRWLQ